jgi:NADH:quinone reductase (non-electrogenic)
VWAEGDVEHAPMMVGQSIGLIHDVVSCRELLERMVAEAERHIREGSARVVA